MIAHAMDLISAATLIPALKVSHATPRHATSRSLTHTGARAHPGRTQRRPQAARTPFRRTPAAALP